MDKNLELEIKKFVARKLAENLSLSEIQTMVNEQFKQSMTYMDIRILASTLDVDWQALDPNAKKSASEPENSAEETDSPVAGDAAENIPEVMDDTENAGNSDTVVEVNKIARPGMMFSGTVKFASGSTAEWYVDRMGQLGLENLVGEKPTQDDIEKFQIELHKTVQKMMGRG